MMRALYGWLVFGLIVRAMQICGLKQDPSVEVVSWEELIKDTKHEEQS